MKPGAVRLSPWGPDQAALDAAIRGAMEHPAMRQLLERTEHRLLSMRPIYAETKTLRPGDMWRIPGHVVHSAVAGDAPVKALDVFHPIREDYR